MSGQNNDNNQPTMDTSSFASILEGVKRMRESYDVGTEKTTTAVPIIQRNEVSIPKEPTIPRESSSTPIEGTLTAPRQRVEVPVRKTIPRRQDSARQPNNSNVQTYSSVQVSNSQKGNPLLTNSLMKTTSWAYNNSILSDYYINPLIQILFLSLKYHKLHPEYIWTRLKKLNKGSSLIGTTSEDRVLRLLLVVVDIDSHQEILRKLLDICLKHDLSLVLAWSFEEAGNYIAFCKKYEHTNNRVDSVIKGVKKSDYQSCLIDTLTSIKSVNKTDCVNLLANCRSFKNIVAQSSSPGNTLSGISGLGSRKLTNMKTVCTEPFIYNKDYTK